MDNSKITKYFLGELTEDEIRELFQWVKKSRENRDEFIGAKKLWALTQVAKENVDLGWIDTLKKKRKRGRTTFPLKRFLKVAAAVVLIFGLGVIAQRFVAPNIKTQDYYSSNFVVDVSPGEMSKLILPDGTSVVVNSGSVLSYSPQYSEGERIVELSGEAFFDVAEDSEHPFTVRTKLLDFKVYGTSFNVEAYPASNQVNTTLIDGSLGFIDRDEGEIGKLVPGENLLYSGSDKQFSIKQVDLDLYTSWKDGTITFSNEKLKDVAVKLERWYNVEIVFNNPELAEEVYFGTVMKNKPIDQILKVLSITSSLKYQIIFRNDKPTLIYWE